MRFQAWHIYAQVLSKFVFFFCVHSHDTYIHLIIRETPTFEKKKCFEQCRYRFRQILLTWRWIWQFQFLQCVLLKSATIFHLIKLIGLLQSLTIGTYSILNFRLIKAHRSFLFKGKIVSLDLILDFYSLT